MLMVLFQQPGGMPDFLERVKENQVCLENALVTDPVNLSVSGTVRVRNLDFNKSVHVRYTLDSWKTLQTCRQCTFKIVVMVFPISFRLYCTLIICPLVNVWNSQFGFSVRVLNIGTATKVPTTASSVYQQRRIPATRR